MGLMSVLQNVLEVRSCGGLDSSVYLSCRSTAMVGVVYVLGARQDTYAQQ